MNKNNIDLHQNLLNYFLKIEFQHLGSKIPAKYSTARTGAMFSSVYTTQSSRGKYVRIVHVSVQQFL